MGTCTVVPNKEQDYILLLGLVLYTKNTPQKTALNSPEQRIPHVRGRSKQGALSKYCETPLSPKTPRCLSTILHQEPSFPRRLSVGHTFLGLEGLAFGTLGFGGY